MKKFLGLILSVVCVLGACSTDEVDGETNIVGEVDGETSIVNDVDKETTIIDGNYKVYSINSLEYSILESWTEKISDENLKYYYPEDGMLMVGYTELDEAISNSVARAGFIEGFTSTLDSFDLISESVITVGGTTAYQYNMNNVLSDEEYKTSIVIFDYYDGIISLFMTTSSQSDKDYSSEFENILSSIEFTDGAESTDETIQGEYYFDGTDLVTEDYKITITDYKVIQPGDTGNKYGDTPVIAFWYDTTVAENVIDTKYNPTTLWMMSFKAVQDNDPNVINQLNVGSHPDNTYLDSQLKTIKPGGTVTNAVAYKLTDVESPVTLTATKNLFTNEKLGSYDYHIQ